jgi:hypothetical protein
MNIFCKIVMVVMINVSSSMMYGMDNASSNRAGDPCCQGGIVSGKDQHIESFVAIALRNDDSQQLSDYLYKYSTANGYAENIVREKERAASRSREVLQNAQKMAWVRKGGVKARL